MNESLFMAFADLVPVGTPVNEASKKYTAPKELVLFQVGKTPYRINGQDGEFYADENDIKNIIDEFKTKGRKVVIDYNHSTLDDEKEASGDSKAAGWMKDLIYDPARGLVAILDDWTPKAAQSIENGEYGYFSPVIMFSEDGKPLSIHSCAITNHPAFKTNPTLLLAASDYRRISQIESIQGVIKDCISEQKKVQDIIHTALDNYKTFVGDDPKMLEEMRAFADSNVVDMFAPMTPEAQGAPITPVIPAPVNPISSMPSEAPATNPSDTDVIYMIEEINYLKNLLNLKDFMTWLSKKKATASAAQARIIDAAINDASKAPGAENVQASILTNPPQMMAMSDIASCIGSKDLTSANAVKTEIIALRDIKNKVKGFLEKHNVKSFDDMDKSLATLSQECLDLKIKVKLDSLEAEGKTLPAQRNSLTEMAKKDFKAFSDIVNSMPILYNLNTSKTQIKPFSGGNPVVPVIYSNEEIHVANLMGKTPEECYPGKAK